MKYVKKHIAADHNEEKPHKCRICEETAGLNLKHIFENICYFGAYIKFRVDWYPICMCYRFSDNPWFSDSFLGDQKGH